MSLIAEAGGNFEKPENGQYNAVLADVVDLGLVTSTFKGETKTQPKVRFVWILDAKGQDGKPLWVTQRYTLSLHEKATLYKHLQMILGTAPPVKLDLETLVGITRKLFVVRNTVQDKIYANIMGILPGDPGVAVPVPTDFVRYKNKAKTQAGPQGQPVQTYAFPPAPPSVYTAPATVPPQPNNAEMEKFLAWQRAQQTQPPAAGFYQPPTAQGADVKF
jgi:hypothetical protein